MVYDFLFFYVSIFSILGIFVVISYSLISMICGIIFFSILWFIFILQWNHFFWGALLILLYLGGIMVLFTYSIILLGAVGIYSTYWNSKSLFLFLLFCILGILYNPLGFPYSENDGIFFIYGKYLSFVCLFILIFILFFCVQKLKEDFN